MENILVNKKTFAVVKSKRAYEEAFANIKDAKELSIIIEEDKIDKEDIIEVEKGWRLITFETRLDFNLVGFIAKILDELAKKKISVLVISSYSTDHILVKKENLDKTLRILKKLKIEI